MLNDKVIYTKLIRVYESGKVEDVDVVERNGIFIDSNGIDYIINTGDELVNNSIKQALYVTRMIIQEYLKLDSKHTFFDYSVANKIFNDVLKMAENQFKLSRNTIRDKVTVRLKMSIRQYIKLVQQAVTCKDMKLLEEEFMSKLCYKGKNSVTFAQKEIAEIEEMLRLTN